MTEKEFEKAKKKLANKFYLGQFILMATFIIPFIYFFVILILNWYNNNSNIPGLIFCILLFISAIFFIAVTISGTIKLNKNKIKKVSGKVIEFKKWGDGEGGGGNTPIVKTECGKTKKISGVDRDEDNISIGQKYTFLQVLGYAVAVKSEKEENSD